MKTPYSGYSFSTVTLLAWSRVLRNNKQAYRHSARESARRRAIAYTRENHFLSDRDEYLPHKCLGFIVHSVVWTEP